MHTIEPFYHWRDRYIASEDEYSPFFGREYSEFEFSNRIYNYYIHPQWDEFGSPTLYLKILRADYDEQYAIMELLGEWNDAINNDIMFLKEEVTDVLSQNGINRFILICENVLNFHASDDCYYKEWNEELADQRGWIIAINLREHVRSEMERSGLGYWVEMGAHFDLPQWRTHKPHVIKNLLKEKRNKILYQI